MSGSQGDFGGDDRFQVGRRVGQGGMGVVYEAFDQDRNESVALKMLTNFDHESVSRLKREFRTLADLAHPNLVTYHELISADELWYFTMELIDGVDFVTYAATESSTSLISSRVTAKPSGWGASMPLSGNPAWSAEEIQQRAEQPTLGVEAMGQLHITGLNPDAQATRIVVPPVEMQNLRFNPLAARTHSNRPRTPSSSGSDADLSSVGSLGSEEPISNDPISQPGSSGALSTVINVPLADGSTIASEIRELANVPFDPASTLAWWGLDRTRPTRVLEPQRLRDATRQLLMGVDALHQAGVEHRDLKPSNVLVTAKGRVIILDFGLAASQTLEGPQDRGIHGTPAYMSPEQAHGSPTPASDLYAVGVMLFEALVGTVPFIGSVYAALSAKQLIDPPAPSTLVQNVPPDLDALTVGLLKRNSAERLSLSAALEKLDGHSRRDRGGKNRAAKFVGRAASIHQLHEAVASAAQGQATAVTVAGLSGMGKSALVKRFFEELRERHQRLVLLRGRCYERESVPYKALDSLVDSLSRYLVREPNSFVLRVLPAAVGSLCRLFPVFLEVPTFAEAAKAQNDVPDPQELRRLGFGAMRDLLSALARERLLVLYIDDLQWGDIDSAALLTEVLRPPGAPPLLLVCAYRSDEATESPFLKALLAADGSFRQGLQVREVEVGPLTVREAAELARSLMRHPDRSMAELIAVESEGSPFFVTELVRATDSDRSAGPRGDDDTVSIPRLDSVIGARLGRLTAAARTMLSIIAVAGRPIEQGIAMRATGLAEEAGPALGLLRSERLVRTRGARASDSAEAYHDRIREAVVAGLSAPQLVEHHRQLGLALEASEDADVEALERHFRECGDRKRARRYALLAADRASNALAFDRAATFCRAALEADPDAPDRWQLEAQLASALTYAGRGAEAWRIYQSAANRAPKTEAHELRRLAAENACRTGHVDEGLQIFRSVTKELGIRMAAHPLEALGSLLARRALVRLRGIDLHRGTSPNISSERQQRIDACYSLSVGLGFVDPIQGADFQTRMLLEALSAGDDSRLAIALALESAYAATGGPATKVRTQKLIDAAEQTAKRTGDPHALAVVEVSRAFYNVFVGRWRLGLLHAESGERMLREKCTNVSHEIATAQIFSLWALFNLGDIDELIKRYPEHVRHHLERGDLFAAGSKQTLIGHIHHLALDSSKDARDAATAGMKAWSHRGFHVQHWYELKAMTHIDFYQGDSDAAYERVQASWPAMQRSLIRRVVSIRCDSSYLRARAFLHQASKRRFRGGLIRKALKEANDLDTSGLENTPGWVKALRGSALALTGDRQGATEAFGQAAILFDRTQMVLFGAAARYRQAQLQSGSAATQKMEQATLLLAQRGIVRPDRFIDILVPTVG